MYKWIGFAFIVVLLVACGTGSPDNRGSQASTAATTSEEAGTASEQAEASIADEAPSPEGDQDSASSPATSNPVEEPASDAPSEQAQADIITFGEPLIVRSAALTQTYVPVTNTGTNVRSFTVKATWKTGDQIVATASGAVNDLLPGQTRAANLLSPEPIPETADSFMVEVDTSIVDAPSTEGSVVAEKITFGPPQVTSRGGLTQVAVEVTNNDDKPQSMIVQAMFLNGDTLTAVGSGAVIDIGAGQTKTASLLVQGNTEGSKVHLAVDTVV